MGRLELCLEGLREWGLAKRKRDVISSWGGVGDLGFRPIGIRAVIDGFLRRVTRGDGHDSGWRVVKERKLWIGQPDRKFARLKVQ